MLVIRLQELIIENREHLRLFIHHFVCFFFTRRSLYPLSSHCSVCRTYCTSTCACVKRQDGQTPRCSRVPMIDREEEIRRQKFLDRKMRKENHGAELEVSRR